MSNDINQSSKVICLTPGCGATLPVGPVGGATLLNVTFPDDLKQVSYLLKTGVDRVYCSQCGQFVKTDQLEIWCLISPVRTFYLYVPQKLAEHHPETITEIQKMFEETTSGLHNVEMEIICDAHQFQKQLATVISGLVTPILASFATASQTTEGLEQWQTQYLDKLDRTFFASAYLIANGAIPFYCLVAKNEEAFDDPDVQQSLSGLGPFHVRIVSETDLDREQLQEIIRDHIRRILILRVLLLARQLTTNAQLDTIEEAVVGIIPPEIIDERAVDYLSKTVSYYEHKDDIPPLLKYAYQALLAEVCDLAKIDNPNQQDWAGWYVAFELHRRRDKNPEEFSGLIVSPEFASRTITAEQIWDQYAFRAEEMFECEDFKQFQYWVDLATELGIEEQWQQWFVDNLFFNLEDASEEAIEVGNDVFSEIALREPEISHPLIRSWLRNLAVYDIGQMVTFGNALRRQMFTKVEVDTGVWITCRMSQILNGRMLYRLAKQQVDICVDDLKSIRLWPPSSTETFVDLLTEEGNCLRYNDDPLAALAKYESCRELLSEDWGNPDFRVNERNIAIVLREAGRLSESLSLLKKVYSYADTLSERASILTSIGVCQNILGQFYRAKQSLGNALAILPKGKAADPDRLLPLLGFASAARKDGDNELALEAAFDALEIARRERNLWLQSVAVGLGARIADDIVEDQEQKSSVTDLAIQILQPIINVPTTLRPPPMWDIGLRSLLAERLEAQGNAAEAESLLEQTIIDYTGTMYYDYWKLCAKLAEYAQRRGDSLLARSRLLEARRIVLSTVGRIEAGMDPIGLMFDKEGLQQLMAEEFLIAYQAKEIDAEDLRIVADFQSSVVLSERLWSQEVHNDAELPVDHNADLYSQTQLARLACTVGSGDQHRIAVAQIIEATSRLHLLLTEVSPDNLTSYVLPLALDGHSAAKLIDGISFKLAMWIPARKGDPLANVANWNELATTLRQSLTDLVKPGTHLCVIPGPLSGLPLHLALGKDYPMNYVPSLLIMHWLRQRRLGMPSGVDWRPSRVHDFVVWRVGEHPDVIKHFRQASAELAQTLEAKDKRYTYTGDVDGTTENLLRALELSECVRLSCHGRACVDDVRFELLVAADGQLPPQDTIALDSESGQRFLIDWQDFGEIKGSSPIIFSAACASGMALSLRGGERVGLERYLLRSGTMSYVAPQWPVPVAQIQSLINQIIISYVTTTSTTLSQVVFNEVNKAVANGMPGWIARSVAVHGEWL